MTLIILAFLLQFFVSLQVRGVEEINEESLSLFTLIVPKIGNLLFNIMSCKMRIHVVLL